MFLKKYNIPSSFVYPSYNPSKVYYFLKVYFSALLFRKSNSIIIIQRVHTNFIYSSALKILLYFQKKDTLYDLDDAEYFNFPPKSIHYFMKNCEACSVGSNAIIEYTQKYNPNVFLLTSPVLLHDITKKERNELFTIGWIGDFGGEHKKSMFNIFFPAIINVNFQLKLIILGVRQERHRKEIEHYFSKNKNISIEIPKDVNWQDEMSVYERVKQFDIGVCPLVDNEITRAKSAFKIKQYFSCGIPSLCSNVGENANFVQDGENGFICNTPEEYLEKILRIKDFSEENYLKLSRNAKNSVIFFDMEHYCSKILEFYKTKNIN